MNGQSRTKYVYSGTLKHNLQQGQDAQGWNIIIQRQLKCCKEIIEGHSKHKISI